MAQLPHENCSKRLYVGWLKTRQAAGADPDKIAELLLPRMENDPYSFAYQIERAVRARFEAKDGTEQVRRRWGEVLCAIFVQQPAVWLYVALREQTVLSGRDCLAIAAMVKVRRKPQPLKGVPAEGRRPHGNSYPFA